MDNEALKAKATELYEGGMGYVKIANELGVSRDKVRLLLGRKSAGGGNRFKPSKLHVPLELRVINILADTQMRVAIDQDTVEDYAEAIREGAEFPAVSVFTNGLTYWLADGFHRYYAAREAAAETITADVYQGTLRDAQIYAMGANANHGLRRTNTDKRHAVEIALSDEEWSGLPNTEIARMCAVTESFVRKIKSEREEKESHNATPDAPSDLLDTEPERPAENETPLPSKCGQTDSPKPDTAARSPQNTPDQSEKELFKWTVYFNPEKRHLMIGSIQDLASFSFASKNELELFISFLRGQISLWDESN
jgi:transposase